MLLKLNVLKQRLLAKRGGCHDAFLKLKTLQTYTGRTVKHVNVFCLHTQSDLVVQSNT